MLKRVFAIEVLVLRLSKDLCGGKRRVLAGIKDERVTRRILAHLGLPNEAPKLAPAPEEPQGELWPTGPPRDELTQPPAPEEYDQRWGAIDFAE